MSANGFRQISTHEEVSKTLRGNSIKGGRPLLGENGSHKQDRN